MKRVYLIRHGQSANNALPEALRVCDPDLTDVGRRQAESTAAWAEERRVDFLYCSPFLRALETMRPIAERKGVPVHVRADIFEQGGCYSGHLPGKQRGEPGMARQRLEAVYPTWTVDDRIANTGWWGRDYETLDQATQRSVDVATWLKTHVAQSPGVHLFVIHADFKKLLLANMLADQSQVDLPNLRLYNAGITCFDLVEGSWSLNDLNSVSHLTPSLVT
jgi:2,3-bisphosphoglycerate-dependent phosphoglycerate mutase